jgi:hypothetical protein
VQREAKILKGKASQFYYLKIITLGILAYVLSEYFSVYICSVRTP